MRYKEFGKTGKMLSVFGFGGAKFRNGKSVEENAERVIYAYEKGINHFDSNTVILTVRIFFHLPCVILSATHILCQRRTSPSL